MHTVAGTFFELLVLKSRNLIDLEQDEPYADIRIKKTVISSKHRLPQKLTIFPGPLWWPTTVVYIIVFLSFNNKQCILWKKAFFFFFFEFVCAQACAWCSLQASTYKQSYMPSDVSIILLWSGVLAVVIVDGIMLTTIDCHMYLLTKRILIWSTKFFWKTWTLTSFLHTVSIWRNITIFIALYIDF